MITLIVLRLIIFSKPIIRSLNPSIIEKKTWVNMGVFKKSSTLFLKVSPTGGDLEGAALLFP
jgi:hypothetical protein